DLAYDASNRLTGKTETVDGVSHDWVYEYDTDGQLLTVKRDGAVAETYAYDTRGNRTSRKIGAAAAQPATYDAQDRLLSRAGTAYTFDAAGFMTARGSDAFTYSAGGELLQAVVGSETVNYAYDALGRRVARIGTGGARYEYLY